MSPDALRFHALGGECALFAVGVAPARLEWGRRWVLARHARFSRFEPGSELSSLNRAAGRWTEVSDELEAMLRSALEAHTASGGLVHAGVLHAMLAIGYTRPLAAGPTAASAPPRPPPPLPEMLEVSAGRARLRPGTGLDLGGIAKGWLADRLASELGSNVLVNLAGDLFARGPGPAGRGWPVGMGGVTVMLRDRGAATSGTWRRRWRSRGRVLHHLIDPRSGGPAQTDLVEASAVAETACQAEVDAKAALLLGSRGAPGYLSSRAPAWSLR